MKFLGKTGKRWGLFFAMISTSGLLITVKSQEQVTIDKQQELKTWESQQKMIPGLLPTYFAKESTKGSPYFSRNWMIGIAEMWDRRRIPGKREVLYFNYDKYQNRLYVADNENHVWSYPPDSVTSFILSDSGKIYSFEKIPVVSDKFFLVQVVKSVKGYSLYKRPYSRLIAATYRNQGYYSTGEKFDEYVDEVEYYLFYPDNQTIKKFSLKKTAVQKAFRDERIQVDEHIKSTVTEKDLIEIVNTLNKNYPEKVGKL